MATSKSLEDRLRDAIRASGMTQYEIAKAVDCYPSTISRFLGGSCSIRLDLAERLMDLLGFKITGPTGKRKKGR